MSKFCSDTEKGFLLVPTERLERIENQLSELLQRNAEPLKTSDKVQKFADLDWFLAALPKKVARATFYTKKSQGYYPKHLFQMPSGTKQLIFDTQAVLEWIETGMCSAAEYEVAKLQTSKRSNRCK